jgi:hypothetical protein
MSVFQRLFGRNERRPESDIQPASHNAPALCDTDRQTTEAVRIRSELVEVAGPHLGPALEFMFDNKRGSIDRHDQRYGMTTLFSADKGERGRALSLLLQWLVIDKRHDELQKVGRSRGRWAHEFAADDWQGPSVHLEILCFALAKSDLELTDRDRDHARLVSLLCRKERFTTETSRQILRQLLKTVTEFPGGETALALRGLAGDSAFAAWMGEIDLALAGSAPSGSSATALASSAGGLPPLELPVFIQANGQYLETQKLLVHFGNIFEVRAYEGASDAFLSAMARVAHACAATPAAALDPQYGGYPVNEAQRGVVLQIAALADNVAFSTDIYSEYFSEVLDWIAWIDDLRETFRPFIRTAPDLLPRLAALSRQIEGKAAPTTKWLAEGHAVFATVPAETWSAIIEKIAGLSAPIGTSTEPCLRTVIYLARFLPADCIGPRLVNYALKQCYANLPGHGIRSEKLGNACVSTLAEIPDGSGIPYLARILARTKYPKIKARIDARLNEAAAMAGISRQTLDELTVPTHDLDADGRVRYRVGDGEAIIRIASARKVAIDWIGQGGKDLKAPSAAMKADGNAVKTVRDAAKELEADISIQPARVQRLYLEDRTWPIEKWRECYLDHPLVGWFARRLIWWVEMEPGGRIAAFADDAGDLRDVSGALVSSGGATIRLWHPIDTTMEAVDAWRDRLEAIEIVQPFAQAWREVYALTDAERATGTYSNRWAAHILRQHQAMTLGRIHGWRVTHRMWVDAPNDEPWHLMIPAHGLVADYWVEGAGGDDPEVTESAAYVHVLTDRVQFHTMEEPSHDCAPRPPRERAVPLAEIPPLVFSEVMRQADLMTSVASIAADPNWLDRGGDAAHPSQWGQQAAAYWTRTNTAELEGAGRHRRAVLERIIPRLSIADRLEFEDRYLAVEGKRHRYRIHLGSGACFRGERHICIVPKADAGERIWLPFEGDRTVSIIISKALLLAADDRITDPVILHQL